MYMRAFLVLSQGRNYTFGGALPITFEAIDRYASRYGIDNIDDFERFLYMITRLDAAYLKSQQEKPKKKS